MLCSNNAPGNKNGPAWGHMFYMGLYSENKKVFLSETSGPRAMIFGMYHHLGDLYQVCSNCRT